MKVLLVGSGGRESALAWALSRSPSVGELICAPGNPGIAEVAECIDVADSNVPELVDLATRTKAALVVIGPEVPLSAGLADELIEKGLSVFGPTKAGAQLESSKSFAKSLMSEYSIPTATGKAFQDPEAAKDYARQLGGVAVKADGLAAGKGVVVCSSETEADSAIDDILVASKFGDAGSTVVIEEKLEGEELSLLALFDGKSLVPLEPAQDYKQVFEGDRGPNTGGMGSFSPVPGCTADVFDQVLDKVLEPVGRALVEKKLGYRGVIYAGLMLTAEGPKVIEFNARFGDPETQALIPRLDSDLAEVLLATAEGKLDGTKLAWNPQSCVTVVAASEGYPGDYEIGRVIEGVEAAAGLGGLVFHAGTRGEGGDLKTAGGRVLSVSALGDDLKSARDLAYRALNEINFEGKHFRNDIASGTRR